MQSVLLNRVFDPPPEACGPASFTCSVPRHQPALETGVAQIFTTARARKDALAHAVPGHYYQRESHPTSVELAERVSAMLGATSGAVLFESGKAACVATLKALTPKQGRILYDCGIYYEVQRELLALAAINGWKIQAIDFADLAAVMHAASAGPAFDLFYLDNPRNWFLTTMDIAAIEHFDSNPRYREGIAREATNEIMIPADMVRLGIGNESAEKIIDHLKYALNMVVEYNAIDASDSLRSKTA